MSDSISDRTTCQRLMQFACAPYVVWPLRLQEVVGGVQPGAFVRHACFLAGSAQVRSGRGQPWGDVEVLRRWARRAWR